MITITKLERDQEGYWRCRVSSDGDTYSCNRRWGSWQLTNPQRIVMPGVAALIQEKVRKLERAERRLSDG